MGEDVRGHDHVEAIKRGDGAGPRKTVEGLLARAECDVVDGNRPPGGAADTALTETAKHTEPAA